MLRYRLRYEPDEVVEDLVQECVIKLLRQLRAGEVREVGALMASIARCTAIDHIRRKTRWATIVTREPEQGWDPVDISSRSPDSLEDPVDLVVSAAKAFFRETDSACLELTGHYFHELDWSEVAEMQDRTSAAVRKQWSRCLDRLRTAARTLPEFSLLRELFGST
ncbi:MAG: hypothetical protein DHS20C21_00010 [Gemmatimonadota bacterium]|nr:MAG: hypothetical protein DHS20C21_00010 [Gemmatimonadota bacterium]